MPTPPGSAFLIAEAIQEAEDRPEAGGIVARAPLAVPVFWLALFDEGDVVELPSNTENGDHPPDLSLSTDAAEARRRFHDRRTLISARFVAFDADWATFDARLQTLNDQLIHIDVAELQRSTPTSVDDLAVHLRDAIRWFDSRDEDDFDRLLTLAGIQDYDLARRTFTALHPDLPHALPLCGELEAVAP